MLSTVVDVIVEKEHLDPDRNSDVAVIYVTEDEVVTGRV